jgi:hypothetical protein
LAERLLKGGALLQLQIEFTMQSGEQRMLTTTGRLPVSADRVDVEAAMAGGAVAVETIQRAADLAHNGKQTAT